MKNQRKKEKRGKFYAFNMEKFRKTGFLDRKTRSQVTRVSPDHQKELRKNHCFYLSPYSFQPHKNMLYKRKKKKQI